MLAGPTASKNAVLERFYVECSLASAELLDRSPFRDEVKRAGGKLLQRGEFSPGYPYAYVADPDGYEVEIWYE